MSAPDAAGEGRLNLPGLRESDAELVTFIAEQVCCPRIHGCELGGAEECPAERVRAALLSSAEAREEAERANAEIEEAFDAAAKARDEAGFLGTPADCINYLDAECRALTAQLQAAETRAQQAEARVERLEKVAEDIEALIDEQTYDERRRADFDMPDDAELCVMVPAGVFRKLSAALTARQALGASHG